MNASNRSESLELCLNHLSNDPVIREMKPWKSFVRVGTDDLEGASVERAISRFFG